MKTSHLIRYRPPHFGCWLGGPSRPVPGIPCPIGPGAGGARYGPARRAILDFVRATTDRASPKFFPVEDRIATFDQDGTLWVEHAIYTQVVYCLDRVPAAVASQPELKEREPFNTVLSGNREEIAKLSLQDLEARPRAK